MSIVTISRLTETQQATRGAIGKCMFTITDATGASSRVGIDVRPENPATAGWFRLSGATECDLHPHGTASATVSMTIPADAAAGSYPLRIRVYQASNPENCVDSDPVRIEITAQDAPAVDAPAATPANKPWWILWVALGVLAVVLIGIVVWLLVRSPAATLSGVTLQPAANAGRPLGGSGGNPYTIECPAGTAAIGVHGGAGNFLDRIGLSCAAPGVVRAADNTFVVVPAGAADKTRTAGGRGGRAFDDTCPDKGFVTGFNVGSGRLIDRVSATCGIPVMGQTGGSTWRAQSKDMAATPARGGPGGRKGSMRCPDGSLLTGLHGRSGNLVDQAGLRCSALVAR